MEKAELQDWAAHEIRDRISTIESEIKDEHYARDVAYTRDYEFRVSDAHIAALKMEKEKLKEILGDL